MYNVIIILIIYSNTNSNGGQLSCLKKCTKSVQNKLIVYLIIFDDSILLPTPSGTHMCYVLIQVLIYTLLNNQKSAKRNFCGANR